MEMRDSGSDPALHETLLGPGSRQQHLEDPEDPPAASTFAHAAAGAAIGDHNDEASRTSDPTAATALGAAGGGRGEGEDETVVESMRRNVNRVKDIIQDPDMESRLEKLFKLQRRGTTWQMEVYCGVIQFISCVYVLPVVPLQLKGAGFGIDNMISITVSHKLILFLFLHLFYVSY